MTLQYGMPTYLSLLGLKRYDVQNTGQKNRQTDEQSQTKGRITSQIQDSIS